MTTFSIRTEEWLAAHDAVTAADPDVTNPDHGVAVVVSNGQRHWYAWSDQIVVMTAGVDAGGAEDMELPVHRRMLSFALPLSYLGEVTLAVDGVQTTVVGAGNCGNFDHPDLTAVPRLRWDEEAVAEAHVSAGGVRALLNVCRALLDEADPQTFEVPSLDVSITSTGLVAAADWRSALVPDTHMHIDAKTAGCAARSVSGPAAVQLLTAIPREGEIELRMAANSALLVLQTERWSASIATIGQHSTMSSTSVQLTLFDPADYPGGLREDPLPGASYFNVRSLAIDPDPAVRSTAAATRWNWDIRLQRALATDPDERVVRALLDHVDPYLEVFELIIDGRHVAVRRELAQRKDLRIELIERLAADDDPIARSRAAAELSRRRNPRQA